MDNNFKKRFYKYKKELETNNYLRIDECKNGYTYRIHARNANFGIYNENTNAFIIRRLKFGYIYTFEEIHWDRSDDFGTVKPFEEKEKSPFEINTKTVIGYLNETLENLILEYLRNFESKYERELEKL